MHDNISKNELDQMLDIYQRQLQDNLKFHPLDNVIIGKLEAIRNIRHRILVLSKGGFRIVNNH